ncbi:uncharacterized protein EURHEDRAFT_305593 [Aspergillus ruber CBS 135680]|uniref:LITAF domain-containing protein n=1 Tax=Aspergillus ruber (strain CBS 135680) TaxID=1388766 RepID=A0A017SLB6_ASPRC|nr:uncharacterized protein EURHEDRAFT_305593 [Aspergillus ruber CBS 135680]EYE97778.1 hypothetical protein EURHEDRAFT_305593 [Aspergillus ruber CBS 135680]
MIAAILCCISCGICCAFLPCILGLDQDIYHLCTNCNRKVVHKPHNGPLQVLAPRSADKVVSKYAPVGVMQPLDERPIKSPPAAQVKTG